MEVNEEHNLDRSPFDVLLCERVGAVPGDARFVKLSSDICGDRSYYVDNLFRCEPWSGDL